MWKSSSSSLAAVLAVGFLVSLVSAQNPCANQPDGRFVNDFTACEAFYTCVRNMPVPGRCEPAFFFNEERQMCDHPWNVISARSISRNLEGVEFFPIENECAKYTLCINGRGHLQMCGENLLFDRTLKQCVPAETADCEQSVCRNHFNPNIPQAVPDPDDCASYFMCFGGQIVQESTRCAGDLLFDPVLLRCNFPDDVECETDVRPPSILECNPTGLHNIPCLKCPPGGFKNVAVEGACRAFVQCFLGVATDRECPEGLLFDAGLGQCNLENKVQC
ncbi:conserved hypothetical protein [Culex quinquefasciatus]|uniref:Chitin-binding type-2 domain-containing protein n=1 Tax=Culex quinquefasciatus TaxID=7176 RepID=B0WAB2_CULQU|nr:conserved hypothetical protein [Culex quinquefasciatus]|eukprot:XP_001845646.1 conserved hypothetical protein [Culex quinquefasciatus]